VSSLLSFKNVRSPLFVVVARIILTGRFVVIAANRHRSTTWYGYAERGWRTEYIVRPVVADPGLVPLGLFEDTH
jgi:hypothetical protein